MSAARRSGSSGSSRTWLILARVERGADVLEVSPVLLHRLLPEVLQREQTMWPTIDLETAIPVSVPLVSGDEPSISLVIRNLVSNAAKYAGAGCDGASLRGSRRSGGGDDPRRGRRPGISPAEADKLFDLYFRSGSVGTGARLRDRAVRVPPAGGRDGRPDLGQGPRDRWRGVRVQPAPLDRGDQRRDRWRSGGLRLGWTAFGRQAADG